MFISNSTKNTLVNVDHIITVSIVPPYLERKYWEVVASLTQGMAILFRGSEEDCDEFLGDFCHRY